MNRYLLLGLAFGLTMGAAIILSTRAPSAPPSALADHRTLTIFPGP
jgi:hypothetical protein